MTDIGKLEKSGEHIIQRLVRFEGPALAWISSLAIPAWLSRLDVKAARFRMLWLNNYYEEKYGVSLRDYADRFHEDVWGPEIAETFDAGDRQAMLAGSTITLREPAPTREDPGRTALFVKTTFGWNGGVYLGGMEVRE